MTRRRRDRLTPAQAEIAILSVIPYAAKATRGRGEDAFSEALVALCHAAQKFEPSRDVSFFTYAVWKVRGRLSHHRRLRVRVGMVDVPEGVHYPCRPLSEVIANDEQAALAIPITIDPPPSFIEAEAAEWLWEQVRKTAVCHRDYLVTLAYFHGLTMGEIAAALGCSRARVTQRVKRTVDRLKANAERLEGVR